jgi:hypothetical protein
VFPASEYSHHDEDQLSGTIYNYSSTFIADLKSKIRTHALLYLRPWRINPAIYIVLWW